MDMIATEHHYEVRVTSAVGNMSAGWYDSERLAILRRDNLLRAREANGFGGSVWIERDGERWEPDN